MMYFFLWQACFFANPNMDGTIFERYTELFKNTKRNADVDEKLQRLKKLGQNRRWSDKTGKHNFRGSVVSIGPSNEKVTLRGKSGDVVVTVSDLGDDEKKSIGEIRIVVDDLDVVLGKKGKPGDDGARRIKHWSNPRPIYEKNAKNVVDFYQLDYRIGETVSVLGSISTTSSIIDEESEMRIHNKGELFFRPVRMADRYFSNDKGGGSRKKSKKEALEDFLKKKSGTGDWMSKVTQENRGTVENAISGQKRRYQYTPTVIGSRINPFFASWSGTTATAPKEFCEEVYQYLDSLEKRFLPEQEKWLLKILFKDPGFRKLSEHLDIVVELEAITRITGQVALASSHAISFDPRSRGFWGSSKISGRRMLYAPYRVNWMLEYPRKFGGKSFETCFDAATAGVDGGKPFKLPNLEVSKLEVVALVLRVALVKKTTFDNVQSQFSDMTKSIVRRFNEYSSDSDNYYVYIFNTPTSRIYDRVPGDHPSGTVTIVGKEFKTR